MMAKSIELWNIHVGTNNYCLVAIPGNSFDLYLNGEFLQSVKTAEQLISFARTTREQLERGIPAKCAIEQQKQEDEYSIMWVSRRWNTDMGRVMKNGRVASDVMPWDACEMYIENMKREGRK
jgi:hypothetical protein